MTNDNNEVAVITKNIKESLDNFDFMYAAKAVIQYCQKTNESFVPGLEQFPIRLAHVIHAAIAANTLLESLREDRGAENASVSISISNDNISQSASRVEPNLRLVE